MSVASYNHGFWLEICFGVFFSTVIIALSVIDVRNMLLPDGLNLSLAAGGIGQVAVMGWPTPLDACLGALLSFLLLWITSTAFRFLRGIDGLGQGDTKFATAASLWIGWQGTAPMLLVASCSALAFVMARRFTDPKFQVSSRLPFGPFIGLGAVISWFLTGLSG